MRRQAARRAGTAALALALVAGCSGTTDDDADATTTTPAPTTTAAPGTTTTTTPPPDLGAIELGLQEIGSFDEPVAFAARPGSPDLYIGEKGGTVRRVDVTESSSGNRYQVQRTPVLDISDEVVNQGEQGLLGIAFSSDGRRLYVHFSLAPNGDTRVVEYDLGDGEDIEPRDRRTLLEVEQPAANHNGGQLAIGPDGYLYIALGDGGGAGDPDGNAQNPDVLLGKILRVDPEGATGDEPYAIPAGNPFTAGGGRPEIWLLGARNPWRFSFDQANGDLWIADVGQNAWEEIDWLPAAGGVDAGRGVNLGWDRMEGAHEFEGDNPEGAVLPIHEYGRDQGCSITGGFVYRGTAIPGLAGTYLYGDYCEPGIRGIAAQAGQVVAERTWDLPVSRLASFGEGPDSEIYVLSQDGPVSRLVPGG